MRPVPSAIVLAALLALAGCFGGGSKGGPAPGHGSSTMTGTDVPEGNATGSSLDAPTWTVGQSWRWTITAGVLANSQTVTTTVLAADGGSYDVGIALSTQGAGAYPFHLIPLGLVDAATLAWEAHGLPVNLVRFPLQDGDAYTADLWGAPGAQITTVAMEVDGPDGLEPGFRSTASYSGGGTFVEADYAPGLGQFVRVASYFGQEE